MTHEEKRIFFNWLKKYGALKAYKQARYQQKRAPLFDSYKEMPFKDPIVWSFNWRKTLEGSDFWSNLTFKWYDYLRLLKHK